MACVTGRFLDIGTLLILFDLQIAPMTTGDKASAKSIVRKNDNFMTQIDVPTCNDIEDGKPFDFFSVLILFLFSGTCLGHHERHSNNIFTSCLGEAHELHKNLKLQRFSFAVAVLPEIGVANAATLIAVAVQSRDRSERVEIFAFLGVASCGGFQLSA